MEESDDEDEHMDFIGGRRGSQPSPSVQQRQQLWLTGQNQELKILSPLKTCHREPTNQKQVEQDSSESDSSEDEEERVELNDIKEAQNQLKKAAIPQQVTQET